MEFQAIFHIFNQFQDKLGHNLPLLSCGSGLSVALTAGRHIFSKSYQNQKDGGKSYLFVRLLTLKPLNLNIKNYLSACWNGGIS